MPAQRFIDFRKLIRSFAYAARGLVQLLLREQNARIHLIVTTVIITTGIIVKLSYGEWIGIVVAIALVWVAEAMNTAIEKLVDLVSPQRQPQAGLVKDLAAGGVLICAIASSVIGALIFLPKFF